MLKGPDGAAGAPPTDRQLDERLQDLHPARVAGAAGPGRRRKSRRRQAEGLNGEGSGHRDRLQHADVRRPAVPVVAARPRRAAGALGRSGRAPAQGHARVSARRASSRMRERYHLGRRSRVLAVAHPRVGVLHRRARRGPQARVTIIRKAGRRHRDPAGRIGVDVREGRQARSLAAIDPVSAHVRRRAELEGRSRRAGDLRAHRRRRRCG